MERDKKQPGKIGSFFGNYWMYIIPVVVIVSAVGIYCLKFGIFIMDNTKENNLYEKFGQFGDYFGGVINPILAFINILLIVYYQNSDFKKQQKQASNKGEKDQILGLISMHCSLRDQLVLLDHGVEIKGLALFSRIDQEIAKAYVETVSPKRRVLLRLKEAYVSVYEGEFRKQYLGHYFRSLYQVYKYIDNSTYIAPNEKQDLAKILRSQISHLELKLLFLNAITDYGAAFQLYIGKYDILEWFYEDDFLNYDESIANSRAIRSAIERWNNLTSSSI